MSNVLLHKLLVKFQENKLQWRVVSFTGFAMFFVLYVYKAYNIQDDLSDLGYSLFAMAMFYALATSLTFAFNEFILADYFFKLVQINKKVIFWIIWEVVLGDLICFLLFNYFWNWTELTLYSYGLMFFEYWAVVLVPILIARNLEGRIPVLPKNTEINPMLNFFSEKTKQKIQIRADAFLYLKSEDNYLQVFYLSNQKVKSVLIRNTLKNIEEYFVNSPYLKRCHRGFIINPQKIISISTQNQQLFLDLDYTILIPVSQKYRVDFQSALTTNKAQITKNFSV